MCAEVVMSQDNEQATKTVMTDGLIYYIVPCNKTVLKSNYIYCGYLILDNEQKETIIDIKKRLTKLYAIKDSLPLYIIKTPETKKIYDMLVDKFTTETHHDNIFMTNQTELKENSVVIGSKPNKKKKDTNDKEVKVPNRTKKSIEEPKETKQETPKQEQPTRKESSDDESEQVKVNRTKSKIQRKQRRLISEPNESDNSDDFDKPAESAPQ